MKETIKYYYNIDVDNIDEHNGKYHFIYENRDYFLIYYNRSIDELNDIVNCNSEIKAKGSNSQEIISNINNEYLTMINGNNYILLSVISAFETYDIYDILDNNKKLVLNYNKSRLYRNNWEYLWSQKVDYFEYQIRELGLNKEIIKNSFSYYIGLAENAISYVNMTNEKYPNYLPKVVLSHRRIYYPNYKLNYYNPLSFIFDIEVRDAAEYLKSQFFTEGINDTYLELKDYLNTQRLDDYLYHMLFARLLYPSYYFDIYEDVMNKERQEEDLIKIIKEVNSYEKFIKKAYFEISKYTQLEKIDWLIY